MVWQDIANAVAGIELVCSMFPMVLRGRSKLALSGILTSFGLIVFTTTFATLGLTFSAITTGIQSGLWTYIVFRWGRKSKTISENKNSKSKKVDFDLTKLGPCSEECYTGPNCPHREDFGG